MKHQQHPRIPNRRQPQVKVATLSRPSTLGELIQQIKNTIKRFSKG